MFQIAASFANRMTEYITDHFFCQYFFEKFLKIFYLIVFLLKSDPHITLIQKETKDCLFFCAEIFIFLLQNKKECAIMVSLSRKARWSSG